MKILPPNRYISNTGMLDMIFLLLMTILMLFIILLAILKTKTHDPAIENMNAYVIQMDWSPETSIDVDMWVLNPIGDYVSYSKKSAPGLVLQQDDLGSGTDTITKADGTIEHLKFNQEIVNIRQWHVGRHYVNAHVYKNMRDEAAVITVKIIRVNPFQEYESHPITLSKRGSEHTMLTFDIKPDGSLKLFPAIQYPFILGKKKQSTSGTGSPNPLNAFGN